MNRTQKRILAREFLILIIPIFLAALLVLAWSGYWKLKIAGLEQIAREALQVSDAYEQKAADSIRRGDSTAIFNWVTRARQSPSVSKVYELFYGRPGTP